MEMSRLQRGWEMKEEGNIMPMKIHLLENFIPHLLLPDCPEQLKYGTNFNLHGCSIEG